ncbi:MAG: hypothetical protein ABSD73_10915 [Candidatus Bathyarchaeia archaeon]|jgi:hypothetical protein
MVKVKSAEQIVEKYVMGSMDSYLRGEKNLNWVIGMIRSSGLKKTVLQGLFSIYQSTPFQDPRKNTLFQELYKACQQHGYI